jgi:LPXTG-motif cell wall-anchored protein
MGAMLVCVGTSGILGAAATAQAGTLSDTITVSFADECGYYVKVTVGNTSASPVDYQLGVEDVDATAFTVAAGATAVHIWPTARGKQVIVTSAGLAASRSHDHVEPSECRAPDLDFDGALSCSSLIVLASNAGEVGTQVRIARNGTPVGGLLDLPAGASANRLVPMAEGDVINLQRLTGGADPQWVTVLDGEFHSAEACEGLPGIEITDTCTGVHVKATNTSQGVLALEFAGLPPSGPDATTYDVAAGATFERDFAVADNALVGASWKQGRSEQLMTAVNHARPKGCSSDPGGPLPVTGTTIVAMSTVAGLLLALGGAAIFVLSRRRRRIE